MDEEPMEIEVKKAAMATLISLLPPTTTMEEFEDYANRIVVSVQQAWKRHNGRMNTPAAKG